MNLPNWAQDKLTFLLWLIIGLVLGYFTIITYAIFKYLSKPSKTALKSAIRLIKDKGFQAAMVGTFSIPASILCSLIFWGIIYFSLENIFNITFDFDGRFLLYLIILIITYISSYIYGIIHIIKE